MDFRKTTVLPEDAAKAAQLFRARIYDNPQANFVVLGSGEDAIALVSKAGSYAGDEGDARWVIWARSLDAIRPEIEKLKNRDADLKQLILDGKTKAFTLNVQDTICAVIGSDEPADNVHVSKAFMEADS
jgi:hypothetical protein